MIGKYVMLGKYEEDEFNCLWIHPTINDSGIVSLCEPTIICINQGLSFDPETPYCKECICLSTQINEDAKKNETYKK